jgi:hypothetical protein
MTRCPGPHCGDRRADLIPLVAGLLAAVVQRFSESPRRGSHGDDVSDVRRDQTRVIDDAFGLLERHRR